jgi:hypothetical protein
MTGFNMPKEESTSLVADGDDVFNVETTISDGELTLPILYLNDSLTGIAGLGEKATHKLVTNASDDPIFALNETENSMFVVTLIEGDDSETYAFEIDTITDDNGNNATTLKNLAGGSDVSFTKVGDDANKGNIDLTLLAASDDAKTARVQATTGTTGILSGAKIVTKEGLKLQLPVNSAITVDGNINLTTGAANPTSWIMNVTEEDKDGNIEDGDTFYATVTIDADDGMEVTTLSGVTTIETEDGSKKYEGYVASDLATKVMWDKPSSGLNELEIIYAGEESSADVYVSEAAATSTTSSTVTPVMASAMTAADKAKNLIVVGGSCINTVAAKLITGLETPLCAAEFSAKTGVGAGKYMIKGYDSPYATGKIAVLVAGYEAAQTADAVKVVKAKSALTADLDEVGPTLTA